MSDSNQDAIRSLREQLQGVNVERGKIQAESHWKDIGEVWRNTKLIFAVIGRSENGKSEFIAHFFPFAEDDKKRPPAGTMVRTVEPRMYSHEAYPGVRLVDLPGIGTPEVDLPKTIDGYCKYYNVDQFDAYVMMFRCGTYRGCALEFKMYCKLKKTGKPVLLVSSHFDKVMYDYRRISDENKREMVSKDQLNVFILEEFRNIKQTYEGQMYFVDNTNPQNFDFEKLKSDIADNLPEYKKDKFLEYIDAASNEVLSKKTKSLRWRAAGFAFEGLATGLIPVPFLGPFIDIFLFISFCEYVQQFYGLNNTRLQWICETYRLNKEELSANLKYININFEAIRKDIGQKIDNVADSEGNLAKKVKDLLLNTISKIFGGLNLRILIAVSLNLADDAVKLIPGIGTLIGMATGAVLGYGVSLTLFQIAITNFEEDAKVIVKFITDKKQRETVRA